MIALLFAAQVLAAAPATPAVTAVRPANELIRVLPSKRACMDNAPGRAEVALKTEPSALYRQGDRPAKRYLRWADYPDGSVCAVESGR